MDETEIEEVVSFVYLGSVVSVNGGTEEDVASRIKKQMVYLFNSTLYGEITVYQKELKYEYPIQMWSQYYYMVVKLGKLPTR